MISLHRAIISSQMDTPGPAMSFLTCFCDLPQNEHFRRSESPILAMPLEPPEPSGRADPGRPRSKSYDEPAGRAASSGLIFRLVMTSSTTPSPRAPRAVGG